MADESAPSLRGRHLLYKAGTKKIVDWLSATAASLRDITHILSTQNVPPVPTSTKTTESREKKSYTIKSHDLISLARIITSSAGTAPSAIVKLLEKVIEGRKACALFYAEQSDSDEAANRSHLFFIQVLETVHQLLVSVRSPDSPKPSKANVKSVHRGVNSVEGDMTNIFACLEMEVPSATPLGSAPEPRSVIAKQHLNQVDLEPDQQDAEFALWCHVEDLRDLRRYIQDIWQQYADGSISLLAATMVTETGMSLMRLAGDELTANWPELGSWDDLLESLSLKCSAFMMNKKSVCNSYLFPKGSAGSSRSIKEGEEILDLLCPGAACTLQDVIARVKDLAVKRQWGHDLFVVLGGDMYSFAKFLDFQIHNLCDRLLKPARSAEQWSEFGYGLADYYKSGTLPIWLVSAAQAYCDIYEVIGSEPGCASVYYQNRIEALNRSLPAFEARRPLCDIGPDYSGYIDAMRTGVIMSREVAKKSQVNQEMLDFTKRSRNNIDMTDEMKSKFGSDSLLESMQGMPLASLFGLPGVAGQMLYFTMVRWHRQSSSCANDGGMVIAMANLYSACRRLGLIKSSWHDMDFILANQETKHALVIKSHDASDVQSLLHQYLITLGVPASKFARKRTPECPKPQDYYEHGRQLNPTCNFFYALTEKKMKDRTVSLERGEVVRLVLDQLTDSATTLAKFAKQARSKTTRGSLNPTVDYSLTEILHAFKMNFVKEEPQLNFDLLGFYLDCRQIHYGLRKALGRDDTLLAPYQLVHFVLQESAASSQPLSKTPLATAAEFLALTIELRGNKFSKQAFDQSSGRIPKHLRPHLRQYTSSLPDGSSPDQRCKAIAAHYKASEGFSTIVNASSINFYDANGTDEEFQMLKRQAEMNERLRDGALL
ncbi:hypothetical protein HII31_00397 [Pseudocercospora fuligena]|uniref:DUF6604 domain-containing protein n=1 Tax=Pseudocercospora fuligena TaxID=685502 RepID=A0A8H6VNB5_9PEZI|nr:hypothetical protein HII31_00397 [Pseudocercospora fuligena]